MCLTVRNGVTTVEKANYLKAFDTQEYTTELAKQKVLIAKKDITCYKILQKAKTGYRSLYQNFFYKLDFQYYQTGDFNEKFGIKISPWDWKMYIHRGLHSYTNLRTARAELGYKGVIVECTIPKGSQYFIGQYNDYVSDSIILNKEVN